MFNIGLKKSLVQRLKVDVVNKRKIESREQMNSQVRQILGQRGQGLILMARG